MKLTINLAIERYAVNAKDRTDINLEGFLAGWFCATTKVACADRGIHADSHRIGQYEGRVALHDLCESQKRSGWILTSDTEPGEGERVLAVHNNQVQTALFTLDSFIFSNEAVPVRKVEKWMKLPRENE